MGASTGNRLDGPTPRQVQLPSEVEAELAGTTGLRAWLMRLISDEADREAD